jgi:hypothetical protein
LKGDKVYYGSTTHKYPSNRFNLHRSQYRCGRLICTSLELFNEYGIEHCLFQIIEECNSKEEVQLREKWWICNNSCVNKVIPLITREEQNIRRKENRRIYREANPLPLPKTIEEIKEKKKEYIDLHKDHKKEYDKKYREDKKEKHTLKIHCECGGFYQKKHRSSHFNTQLHQKHTTSPKQTTAIE